MVLNLSNIHGSRQRLVKVGANISKKSKVANQYLKKETRSKSQEINRLSRLFVKKSLVSCFLTLFSIPQANQDVSF